jgi:hypothetical protein
MAVAFEPQNNPITEYDLQFYTDDHTQNGFDKIRSQYVEFINWLGKRSMHMGPNRPCNKYLYGWTFTRFEDAMLVLLTFG